MILPFLFRCIGFNRALLYCLGLTMVIGGVVVSWLVLWLLQVEIQIVKYRPSFLGVVGKLELLVLRLFLLGCLFWLFVGCCYLLVDSFCQ